MIPSPGALKIFDFPDLLQIQAIRKGKCLFLQVYTTN